MTTNKHRAYPMNCAPRVGYDWRVFCRQCGSYEGRPQQIGVAARRSDAVRLAEAHDKQARA